MQHPKISIVLCTYNSEEIVRNCLDSILNQTLKDFEVLCVDGGSEDLTREIVRDYERKDLRVKLLNNPNRFPEGKGNGKWLGFKKSKGKIIGFIDHDNVLQDKKLFKKVFEKISSRRVLGVLGGMKNDLEDSLVVRYVSLVGTDSFFAYRAVDFLSSLRNENKEMIDFEMELDNMKLTGGNCFFYKKSDLEEIGGFDQDVLVVKRLLEKGLGKVLISRDATKHYAERSILGLVKKKFFWGAKYFDKNEKRFDYMPKTNLEIRKFIKNILLSLLIFPNLYYSGKIYSRKKDPVIFIFPILSFLNLVAYGLNFLLAKFRFFEFRR